MRILILISILCVGLLGSIAMVDLILMGDIFLGLGIAFFTGFLFAFMSSEYRSSRYIKKHYTRKQIILVCIITLYLICATYSSFSIALLKSGTMIFVSLLGPIVLAYATKILKGLPCEYEV